MGSIKNECAFVVIERCIAGSVVVILKSKHLARKLSFAQTASRNARNEQWACIQGGMGSMTCASLRTGPGEYRPGLLLVEEDMCKGAKKRNSDGAAP